MNPFSSTDTVPVQSVMAKARQWGFHCQSNREGCWQIDARSTDWCLIEQDDRWVLVIHSIPQIRFLPEEALAFLRRRRFLLPV